MNISAEEAARALQEIEASRAAMRLTIRAHRGHIFLWIWGCVWIAIALHDGVAVPNIWFANAVSGVGVAASILAGIFQATQIRGKIDKRFLAVCATLLLFGYGV